MQDIKEKASYCLHCINKPCSEKGCPLGNNIPDFIEQIKYENYQNAYRILSETTVLSGICGKICPHEKQCQSVCIRGIKGEPVEIGNLELQAYGKSKEEGFTLFDCWKDEIEKNKKKNGNKKVAVIGSGPSGLTAAAFLAKAGFSVTIYEKYGYLGGLLVYGIPDFRLNKEVVKDTVENILNLGIKVEYNKELGNNLTIEELENNYDAIYLGIGANVSTKMGVEGEGLNGVYGGNELLEFKNYPNFTDKKVAIVGGGNVAMDCCRTIKRLGAKEVKVIYRRAREQMPAEDKEIEAATDEGIEFLFQNNIVKIMGDNEDLKEKSKVNKVELIKTELVQREGEKRLSPVNIEGSNYVIDMDYVVMALGSKPENFVKDLGLELDRWGNISVNENYQTSNPKVFAGGDIIGKNKTVAWAGYFGREAAKEIDRYLNL